MNGFFLFQSQNRNYCQNAKLIHSHHHFKLVSVSMQRYSLDFNILHLNTKLLLLIAPFGFRTYCTPQITQQKSQKTGSKDKSIHTSSLNKNRSAAVAEGDSD